MSDQDQQGVGEQPTGREPEETEAPVVANNPPAPRRDLITVSRTQAGLAGAGVLLMLGGGVGGFFIGHATGGDGHGGRDHPWVGRAGIGPRGHADGSGRGQFPPDLPGQDGTGQNGPG